MHKFLKNCVNLQNKIGYLTDDVFFNETLVAYLLHKQIHQIPRIDHQKINIFRKVVDIIS